MLRQRTTFQALERSEITWPHNLNGAAAHIQGDLPTSRDALRQPSGFRPMGKTSPWHRPNFAGNCRPSQTRGGECGIHTIVINRNCLRCSACGAPATTRTAIGHGSYQEFAFPCPGCGVEIRFGMTLDQQKVTFEYTKLQNAAWTEEEDPSATVFTFDGEHLNPLRTDKISPFMATAFLARNLQLFMRHQAVRFQALREFWPTLERLRTHYHREQWNFFREELRGLGYENVDCSTPIKRGLALIQTTQGYGKFFSDPESNGGAFIYSRLGTARASASLATRRIVRHFVSSGRHASLNNEIHSIRQQWVTLADFLLPLFNVFYWDPEKHSLDDYAIAQKRFVELKPFYVDLFETFCRISCIASSIEGAIALSQPVVPTRKGGITIEQFESMANGAKIDLLQVLPIAELFVPFIDPALRNGMGHNAARYIVKSDTVEYTNQTRNGHKQYSMPYIRFCERVVRTYAQFEVVALYNDWLLLASIRE